MLSASAPIRPDLKARALLQIARTVNQVHPNAGAYLGRFIERQFCDGQTRLEWTTRDQMCFELNPGSHCDVLIAMERLEPLLLQTVERLVEPGDTVLDIGANIGGITARMSRAVGADGHVLAYEPNPRVLPALKRNLELNACDNVEVVERAASHVDDPQGLALFLPAHTNPGTASTVDRETNAGGETVEVACERVDARWHDAGEPHVSFAKLDIQGGEFSALQGMQELMEACRPALYIEVEPDISKHAGWGLSDLASLLTGFGYTGASLIRRTGPGGRFEAAPAVPVETLADGRHDEVRADVLFT